jgi:ABC-type transport system involved in multi-copper enzyme maturation permease subunit
MNGILTIAHLTLCDATRRKVVTAALLCGASFLLVFSVAIFMANADIVSDGQPFLQRQGSLSLMTIAGLYAVNFLSVLFAGLLPVGALSGEIEWGVMQTLASKPLRRSQILLGKWFAYGGIVAAYLLMLSGGVLAAGWLLAGHAQINVSRALPLMLLEVMLLVTVSIAGGTRLSTVTNGIAALGFYGIAFVGGWVEQIGGFAGIASAKTVGIVASLISPPDALWRLAAYEMQPPILRDLGAAAFEAASVPTSLAVWWAALFTVAVLAWAVRSFAQRPL